MRDYEIVTTINAYIERKFLRTLSFKLYRISTNEVVERERWPDHFMGYKLVTYSPGFLERPKHGTNFIRNTIWYIITKGNHLYLFLYDGEVLVHSKEVCGYNFRFRYMNRNDIHHQQAFTNPKYRGRGIFTNILKLIPSLYKSDDRYVWVYCDVVNLASQKAIEKAGYEFVSYAKMNIFTKVVKPA